MQNYRISCYYRNSCKHSKTPRQHPSNPRLRQKPGTSLIVRLRHRRGASDEFLASTGNFSFADLTNNRSEAWRFPTEASALTAVRMALGLYLREFTFQIVEVAS